MYNTIYPTNINYRKYGQYQNGIGSKSNGNSPVASDENKKQNNTFPNGQKVAIDYSKGQINISQVLTDFRSTILAINAPKEVQDEVYIYLNLVEKEAQKESPSKEIIIANLKNASKISDNFIESVLGKQSNVVENWIVTLFSQKINLKADPKEINPDYQLKFPEKAQSRIDAQNPAKIEPQVQQREEILNKQTPKQIDDNQYLKNALSTEPINVQTVETPKEEPAQQISFEKKPAIKVENAFELTQNESVEKEPLQINKPEASPQISDNERIIKETKITPFSPKTESDKKARTLYIQAKNTPATKEGDTSKVNLLNEALGILAKDKDANPNIKAALHLERGKVFDNYDYVDYALRDYFEATKAKDFNLKANAHYKSGEIYDEFGKFDPALDNYLSCVAYSGEADNLKAQTKVLNKISSLYTKQYDIENTKNYTELALISANDTEDSELIAKTYSNAAQNYQYMGENEQALNNYKNALREYFNSENKPESYEQMAYNYEQAAIVMENLGNKAKAEKLKEKSLQYYQKAQLAS